MKNAIIYFSHSCNNKLLAQNLFKLMKADVYRLTEPKKRTKFTILMDMFFNRNPKVKPIDIKIEQYNHVLLMAPIWDLKVAHPMRTYIKSLKGHLTDYSFASLCVGREGQKEAIENQLIKWTEHSPRCVYEFLIKNLVSPEYRDDEKYIANYKVKPEQLVRYESQIQQLLCEISDAEDQKIAA